MNRFDFRLFCKKHRVQKPLYTSILVKHFIIMNQFWVWKEWTEKLLFFYSQPFHYSIHVVDIYNDVLCMRVISEYEYFRFFVVFLVRFTAQKIRKCIASIYLEYFVLFSVTNESLSFVRKIYPKPKRNQFKFRCRYLIV